MESEQKQEGKALQEAVDKVFDPMARPNIGSLHADIVRIEAYPLHVKFTFGEVRPGSRVGTPHTVVSMPLNVFMDTLASMNQLGQQYRTKAQAADQVTK